jgi:hypothetical protein
MTGGPMASLWGSARFFEPAQESELLAELRRIADVGGYADGPAGLQAALRAGASELVCFEPPSRRAERVVYTIEGDPVVMVEATWKLRDTDGAFDALWGVPELHYQGETEDGEAVTFDWLASRRELLAARPARPLGAVYTENGPVMVSENGEPDRGDETSRGTFTLSGDRLEFFGLSEARLAGAEELVERHLGRDAGRPRRSVRTLEEVTAQAPADGVTGSVPSASGPAGNLSRREAATPLDERVVQLTYRRWIDDPDQRLGGLSPREAAARGLHLDKLERVLRSFEHHHARERGETSPGPEVTWIRAELGLGGESLAA